MTRISRLRTWRTAVLLAALTVWTAAAPAAAQDDLIDAAPTTIGIDTPAPGHAMDWTMTVTNVTSVAVPLSLRVSGERVPLFVGATPLEVTVRDATGGIVVGPLAAGDLIGQLIVLPSLPAGATYALSGTASLPRSADNSYQGLSGELVFEFVAVDPRTPLAQNGGTAPIVFLLLGGALLTLGVLLLTRRKARTDA